ncbi:DUF4437 domain-containing protein [Pseudoalteromonas sp. XMcav2-N-2]|uniref:DUF4437 domain-containing protein n=1 Tax=unclassified Pseudoalteromonas TaxID=194690 RepID=UPI002097215F|nr:DUF4437 domain-containing protein [Pseudoalteromonas sp. XMcav2-N]
MVKLNTLNSLLAGTLFIPVAVLATDAHTTADKVKVVSTEQIEWGYLNPARGDKSPRAANLWGDRTDSGATGMLVRFEPGFSSPPHIHNVSYRGIVIEGSLHNDDPTAKAMWMPSGSFWTQPAGEDHITSASAPANMIYLEIDSGPYLVKPSAQQFDNGERPVNLHYDNLTWLDQSTSAQLSGNGIEMANLWQRSSLSGVLLRLPANTKMTLSSEGTEFKAVVIQGQLNFERENARQVLHAGSFVTAHQPVDMSFSADQQVLLYVRTNAAFKATGE